MKAAPLWYWMNERHKIYLRRAKGLPKPWTTDPILKQYRFCNVFRELDTVTIWIDQFIRKPYADDPNLPFMLALARTINWPPTLKMIMDKGQWPVRGWKPEAVANSMATYADAGNKVYTGAYMIRAESDPRTAWYNWSKHRYITEIVLGNVWNNRGGWPMDTLRNSHGWLMQYHGWGPFMAYEVITDLRHTKWLCDAPDITTWANAGPGALRGINRLLGRPLNKPLPQPEARTVMQELLAVALEKGKVPSILGMPLEMRDIEHSLCEMDKYLRVKNNEGRPRSLYNGV